ncbi:MAG: HAMP domain-containing histidine kinase [Lachnospiraceae bacterium]|nr:HAMP domain-containing histidine kinase [Lachnospiraceae bacterium]
MSRRNSIAFLLGLVLSVSLLTMVLTAGLILGHERQAQFDLMGNVLGKVVEAQPEAEQTIAAVLKEYQNSTQKKNVGNILPAWGYDVSDFRGPAYRTNMALVGAGFLLGVSLLTISFFYRHRKEKLRIQMLTEYLEKAYTGQAEILATVGEDDFSKLEDEIYKTITALYQAKESALEAKKQFARNLFNIAHQLKTPITAISLSAQMMRKSSDGGYPEKIVKQLDRLTYLEESLLVLARMDAGTLTMEPKETDVFTLLMLVADNLQELFAQAAVSIDIPELGEMSVLVDLDWTVEAVMNLMKNCMEHTPTGHTVHCAYSQNPMYTEICIWDEGKGFVKEDIPHLFERFYRGQNAAEGGVGIGLALAKEIIERQNGTIRAENLPGGGACFTVHFYCH